MGRANVYVDAFNLYYGCLEGTQYRWLDLDSLCRRLLPKDEIHRIRYFTALVTPRPGDDPQKAQRQAVYLRALATIPHLTLHYGHFLTHRVRMPVVSPPPRTIEVYKTEEKGSDVNLATHLLLDAFKGDCEVGVVISNDSDLREPIAVARSELNLTVGVVNPHPPVRRSRALQPSFFKQLRESALRASQFPPMLTDEDGVIVKPARW